MLFGAQQLMESGDNSKSHRNAKLADELSETSARQSLAIRVAHDGEALCCPESPNFVHADGTSFAKTSKSHRLAIANSTRDQRARKLAAFDQWFDITLATPRKTNNRAANTTIEDTANRGLVEKFQADQTK